MLIIDWSSDVCSSDLMRVVAIAQRRIGNRRRAAKAFGHVLPGHLDMDAARVRAFGPEHREEALYLTQDAVERTSLVAAICLDDVAVPRIAAPHHPIERKIVVSGKSCIIHVGLGGGRNH